MLDWNVFAGRKLNAFITAKDVNSLLSTSNGLKFSQKNSTAHKQCGEQSRWNGTKNI